MTLEKKFIVITSIFSPSKAIEQFAKIPGWKLIVVGDRKTPKGWSHKNVTYLSPEDQERLGYEILKHLPWNHYTRKMVGYLYAMSEGADIIYDTDDDNIPLENWHEPEYEGTFDTFGGHPFINIYSHFTDKKIWPRGIPLKEINRVPNIKRSSGEHSVRIWQFLADGDPDVDAIYRLTDNTPVVFDKKPPVAIANGCFTPINSQNTFFHKDVFPLLYLPAFVTFRFTDILRGLIAQPVLWSRQFSLGFGTSTVVQERNEHDYFKDFESEIPMYLYAEKSAYIAKDVTNPSLSIQENLLRIYKDLFRLKIVSERELSLLKAWLSDIDRLGI